MITADELQQENDTLILKNAKQVAEEFGVETTTLVRIGIASDEVKALTREQKIDLVIMGMKGSGGFEKIVGSTTTNVIHKVKSPVLIVPQEAKYKAISNITYASDFSYQSSFHLFDP
jgi:nucleotide-binding universal stress UspA family protein